MKNRLLAISLVDRLIQAGSPICAVSDIKFVVSDTDISPQAEAHIAAIMHSFEPIEPLRVHVVEYLRELGRDATVRGQHSGENGFASH